MSRAAAKMFGTHTAYNFRDKDPICDILATICKPYPLVVVAEKTGVPKSTLHALFYGETISPRYCTVSRITLGMGAIVRVGQVAKKR